MSHLPEPTLDCTNAWLAPDGRCFPNPGYAHHSRQADTICVALGICKPEAVAELDCRRELIKRGWAFLRDGEGWRIPDAADRTHSCPERLTARQRDAIFDWCMKNGKNLPSFLQPATDGELVAA